VDSHERAAPSLSSTMSPLRTHNHSSSFVPPFPGYDSSGTGSSSSASSAGLLTPPSYVYGTRIIPLPDVYTPRRHHAQLPAAPSPLGSPVYLAEHVQINPNLAAPPTGHRPHVAWDVMIDPMACHFSDSLLAEPLTHPPLRNVRICITRPHYPWDIRVEARDSSFVTVGDFLRTVYRNTRIHITPAEGHDQPADLKAPIATVYHQRVALFPDVSAKKAGVRRIDYLLGSIVFGGLKLASAGRIVKGQLEDVQLEMRVGRA